MQYLPESEIADARIIDTRPSELFIQGHIKNSLSIPYDKKFETWLGAIVSTAEPFVLLGENQTALEELNERAIKIGYDKNLKGLVFLALKNLVQSNAVNITDFEEHRENYLIIDVRNVPEVKMQTIFEGSINIPLYQLRERMNEIPDGSVLLVHCAAGYRSGVATAILEAGNFSVYDLGASVKKFITAMPMH